MNTIVSFEIAKLLKEKGFKNTHCRCFYRNDVLVWINLHNVSSDSTYLAPTIADVVMWLYEKHKIYIWVAGNKRANNKKYFDYYFSISKLNDKSSNFFNSPTEAYEKAIEYYLNKLIWKKNYKYYIKNMVKTLLIF